MNSDEKIEVLKAREYIVSKSNQLVQKTRYNFTVQEQRTVAYICSKIKPIETKGRAETGEKDNRSYSWRRNCFGD